MQIDNLIIGASVLNIITELKSQLQIRGVNLFAKYFDSGADIMVCCPYHKEGKERNPSAGIRKSDGMFHCLACGETHSLPEVITDCFGETDYTFGYKWLIKNFSSTEVENREDIALDLERNGISYKGSVLGNSVHNKSVRISDKELDKYRYIHPYLYERGLNDEIIEKFDLGYDEASDSITFPVRDRNGDCMFIARREIHTKVFDLPKGITKPLYGMYELEHTKGFGVKYPMELYVCEGMFDCLRLWCNNKPAVAGFGCLFNSYQIKQLQDLPIRAIVLALDNDQAGREATERLRKLLTNKLVYKVVLPEGRKDIGECTDEEIQNLKEIL